MTPLLSDGVVDRAPDPLACRACAGHGTVAVRPDCIHPGSNGRCPCGPDEAPCAECEGTGRVPCHCGEPADRIGRDGGPACSQGCSGGVLLDGEEPDEDLRDGPDYAGLMASARALDRGGW